LFGGLLGSGGDNLLEIKAKKLAKKKEVIFVMKLNALKNQKPF
jgi:hypothetical protein